MIILKPRILDKQPNLTCPRRVETAREQEAGFLGQAPTSCRSETASLSSGRARKTHYAPAMVGGFRRLELGGRNQSTCSRRIPMKRALCGGLFAAVIFLGMDRYADAQHHQYQYCIAY